MTNESLPVLQAIYNELNAMNQERARSDLWLQYPNSALEMLFPANTTRTIIQRRIDRMLRSICVNVPANATLEIWSDGIKQFFFSDQSGFYEFENGIYIGDIEIKIANNAGTQQRINYSMIFS